MPVHPLCLLVRVRAQGLDYLQHETAAERRALVHSRRRAPPHDTVGGGGSGSRPLGWTSTARWTARGKSSKFTSQDGGGCAGRCGARGGGTKHGVPHACALQLAVKREGAGGGARSSAGWASCLASTLGTQWGAAGGCGDGLAIINHTCVGCVTYGEVPTYVARFERSTRVRFCFCLCACVLGAE